MTVVSNKKQVHVKKDLNPKDGDGCENIIAKQFEFDHRHDIQPNVTNRRDVAIRRRPISAIFPDSWHLTVS